MRIAGASGIGEGGLIGEEGESSITSTVTILVSSNFESNCAGMKKASSVVDSSAGSGGEGDDSGGENVVDNSDVF